jgi:hypothetical protein
VSARGCASAKSSARRAIEILLRIVAFIQVSWCVAGVVAGVLAQLVVDQMVEWKDRVPRALVDANACANIVPNAK